MSSYSHQGQSRAITHLAVDEFILLPLIEHLRVHGMRHDILLTKPLTKRLTKLSLGRGKVVRRQRRAGAAVEDLTSASLENFGAERLWESSWGNTDRSLKVLDD